jgi:hypothetical protein
LVDLSLKSLSHGEVLSCGELRHRCEYVQVRVAVPFKQAPVFLPVEVECVADER